MDFQLSDDQRDIMDTIKKFTARDCPREFVRELDSKGEYPRKLIDMIAEMGFCGLTVEEKYGGAGRNVLGAVLVAEELSAVYPALAGAFIASAFCGGINISNLGSEEQKRKFLPGLAQGSLLFTYGMSEGGPDMTPEKTIAFREGGKFVLNGNKSFVRLADRADFILTLARTGQDQDKRKGLTIFIVNGKDSAVTVKAVEKLGYNGLSLCEVHFDHVLLPEEHILGGIGGLNRGWEQCLKITETEHLEIAACSLGIAQGAFDYAASYSRERVQFGKPIVKFESIQHMLADMAMDIKAARLMTYQAGWLADEGRPCALEAAMARTYASEMARRASLQCLQILGGYGYTMEYDAQRYLRDSTVLLGGGTAETLKGSVGDLLGL